MQLGPDNKRAATSPTPAGEIDQGAFERFRVNAADPFSRYILHFGVKAVAHAALAHRALEAIEDPHIAQSKLRDIFKIQATPLSFSLSGLQSIGLIVPTAAMTASSVFWGDRQTSPDRVDFAHPDLLNPLIAYPAGTIRVTIPRSFFQVDWSKADLLDRTKMGATLVVADRVWESCVGILRRQIADGEFIIGAIDKLILYYSGYLSQIKVGEPRQQSLAAGEIFLSGLVRRDEDIAARVLNESRLAALVTESAPLEGTLPPHPTEEPVQLAARRPDFDPSSLTPTEQEESKNLLRIRALRRLINDPDPTNRADGLELLRRWQGDFSPLVEAELSRTIKQAARIEHWFARIEGGLQTFERGDTAEGIRVIREVLSQAEIPLIKREARKLLKTFGSVLNAIARLEQPTDEWPKPGAQRRLVDVILAAYTHGSDAEVICHDGLKRHGRLCFGGIAPTTLKLLDFHHEITWHIDLTAIQSIRFFYDENPIPQRSHRRRGPE